MCGAGAGMVAAIVTTPFDVIKTRRQLYSTLVADPSTAHSVIDHSPAAGNGESLPPYLDPSLMDTHTCLAPPPAVLLLFAWSNSLSICLSVRRLSVCLPTYLTD